jgi:hypothetical protein
MRSIAPFVAANLQQLPSASRGHGQAVAGGAAAPKAPTGPAGGAGACRQGRGGGGGFLVPLPANGQQGAEAPAAPPPAATLCSPSVPPGLTAGHGSFLRQRQPDEPRSGRPGNAGQQPADEREGKERLPVGMRPRCCWIAAAAAAATAATHGTVASTPARPPRLCHPAGRKLACGAGADLLRAVPRHGAVRLQCLPGDWRTATGRGRPCRGQLAGQPAFFWPPCAPPASLG